MSSVGGREWPPWPTVRTPGPGTPSRSPRPCRRASPIRPPGTADGGRERIRDDQADSAGTGCAEAVAVRAARQGPQHEGTQAEWQLPDTRPGPPISARPPKRRPANAATTDRRRPQARSRNQARCLYARRNEAGRSASYVGSKTVSRPLLSQPRPPWTGSGPSREVLVPGWRWLRSWRPTRARQPPYVPGWRRALHTRLLRSPRTRSRSRMRRRPPRCRRSSARP